MRLSQTVKILPQIGKITHYARKRTPSGLCLRGSAKAARRKAGGSWQILRRVAAICEVSLDDIRNLEAENGLDIAGEILDEIEKKYSVYIYETDEDNSF